MKCKQYNIIATFIYVKLSLPFPAESFCTADKIE